MSTSGKNLNILVVAPAAPPKNSPEAMQVGRFLTALDSSVEITLVTTKLNDGWVQADNSLAINRSGMKVISLGLPWHKLTQRVLGNHRLSRFHVPDAQFWLPWLERSVVKQIKVKPDVIYSRSSPFSGALLARKLKEKFDCPWMMHLSDPWADSPYRRLKKGQAKMDQCLEAVCIGSADVIALTTEGQAEHYRSVYPERRNDIVVTSNMLPIEEKYLSDAGDLIEQGCLRVVYTGAMYGDRTPAVLLSALQTLHERNPKSRNQIKVDFYGNITPTIADSIYLAHGCEHHGPVPFRTACSMQSKADVLLTIEPDGSSDLYRHFMPSKNLDYISQGRPILAITPKGSETERLCESGHGWAFQSNDTEVLAQLLEGLVETKSRGEQIFTPPDIRHSPYKAESVAAGVLTKLESLI